MSKTTLPCKLCGQQKSLIKAHIIPKQFYRRIMGGTPNLLKFEVDNVVNQTTTQNGIHQNDLSEEKPAFAAVQDFWSKGEFKLLCDFHKKSRIAAGLE